MFRGLLTEQSYIRYVVAAMDVTVYPADAVYVKNAFSVHSAVASMNPNHAGFIMLPVFQKQTTEVARIKHRRAIEDALLKSNLMCGQEFTVLFNKPDSSANDGRPRRRSACCLSTLAMPALLGPLWMHCSQADLALSL